MSVVEQKTPSGARGRPVFKPTDDQRVAVRQLKADDKTHAEIAAAIGISRNTLRKHFDAELADKPAETTAPLLDFTASAPVAQPSEAPIGRPEFEPSQRQRDDVRLWKADDWSDERIARRLGISRNTLLKHFAEELDDGVDQVRARVLRNLMRESDKGSVTACDRILKLPGMIAPAERLLTPETEPEQPLGKKETQRRAAQTAEEGTSWQSLVPTTH
jgi:DNA-binding CsgD family transcriptional regulator